MITQPTAADAAEMRIRKRILDHIAAKGCMPPDMVPQRDAVEVADAQFAQRLEEATTTAQHACDALAEIECRVTDLEARTRFPRLFDLLTGRTA